MAASARSKQVFLNVPYDSAYEHVFIALVAATVAAGLVPRCTLEVPAFDDRRSRIFHLIEGCGTSVHDIAAKDRLNMPFELGYAFAVERHRLGGRHRILVLDAVPHQAQLRLSDLNGKDVHAHGFEPRSAATYLLGQLRRRPGPQPTARLDRVTTRLVKLAPRLVAEHHGSGLFELPVFEALRYAAVSACEDVGLLEKR